MNSHLSSSKSMMHKQNEQKTIHLWTMNQITPRAEGNNKNDDQGKSVPGNVTQKHKTNSEEAVLDEGGRTEGQDNVLCEGVLGVTEGCLGILATGQHLRPHQADMPQQVLQPPIRSLFDDPCNRSFLITIIAFIFVTIIIIITIIVQIYERAERENNGVPSLL